jgi:hypothetical protein
MPSSYGPFGQGVRKGQNKVKIFGSLFGGLVYPLYLCARNGTIKPETMLNSLVNFSINARAKCNREGFSLLLWQFQAWKQYRQDITLREFVRINNYTLTF